MPISEPLRIALVGCGSIAKSGYQPRCLAYPKHIKLHGYFDQHRPSAEALQKIAGAGKVYSSLDDVFNDSEIEAILNLTTLNGHYPVSLAALKAGKHVYSEKPISISLTEANELIRTAEQRQLTLACAPSAPLGYEQQHIWSRMRAGEIGTPHTVLGKFACTRLEYWHPNADIFMTNGVSVVADAAPYPLALMTTYFGPVRRIFGFARNVIPDRVLQTGPRAGTAFKPTIPDHVMGLLEFDNGVRGFVYTGWAGPSDLPAFEVTGTEGIFSLNPHNDGAGMRFLSVKDQKSHALPKLEKAFPNGLDWAKGVVDFADAIRNKRLPRCSGHQARHLVEIAERINAASKAGAMLEMQTTFPALEPVGAVAPWE